VNLQKAHSLQHIQGLSKVLKYPLLSQEGVKLETLNFVRTFIGSIGTGTARYS